MRGLRTNLSWQVRFAAYREFEDYNCANRSYSDFEQLR